MSTLEHWRFEPDGGDWDDVLRRARRRFPLPGRALVAVAAVLVLAGPALGLVGTLGGEKHHTPQLRADLTGPGGVSGTVTAFSPGFWIAKHGGRRIGFTHAGKTRPLFVAFTVHVPGKLTSVRIGSLTLCRPCVRTRYFMVFPKPRTAVKLLSGSPVVTVTAGGKTLRGPLRWR